MARPMVQSQARKGPSQMAIHQWCRHPVQQPIDAEHIIRSGGDPFVLGQLDS